MVTENETIANIKDKGIPQGVKCIKTGNTTVLFKECPVCRTYVLEDYNHIYMKCKNCGQLIIKTKEVTK